MANNEVKELELAKQDFKIAIPSINPVEMIEFHICEPNRKRYLLNILQKFEEFLNSGDSHLTDQPISKLIEYAAVDLATGAATLSSTVIERLNNSNPAKFYADKLTAWIWAVDHSSKGDFNKKTAKELVRQCLTGVDDGTIIGANDGKVHLLEVGCAHGRDFHFLGRKNPRIGYLGIDISPAMIQIARTLNPDGNFQVGNILKLQNVVSEKQAAVFAAAVLHHFNDEEKVQAIGQIRSVLADNGLLFLSLRHGKGIQFDKETGLNYFAITEPYLRDLIRQGGFDVINTCRSFSPRAITYINALARAKPQITSIK